MAASLLGDLFRMALHRVRASARPSLSALALNTLPIHEALAHAARHHAQLQNPNARRSRAAAGAGCSCFPFPELKHLVTPTCPFMNLPETRRSRFGGELNAEKMKKAVWLRPEAVAQIEFLEWTEADRLRHSKFAGLREDKDPRSVVKEQAGDPLITSC